jgi:hypothetical protein
MGTGTQGGESVLSFFRFIVSLFFKSFWRRFPVVPNNGRWRTGRDFYPTGGILFYNNWKGNFGKLLGMCLGLPSDFTSTRPSETTWTPVFREEHPFYGFMVLWFYCLLSFCWPFLLFAHRGSRSFWRHFPVVCVSWIYSKQRTTEDSGIFTQLEEFYFTTDEKKILVKILVMRYVGHILSGTVVPSNRV